MPELYELLRQSLGQARRIAVLGAGSELRSDDAAGVRVVQRLTRLLGGSEFTYGLIMNGSSAPENFTGEIKGFRPDHLLIIDAANIKAEPGSVALIDPSVISGVSFSTHMLPMKVMLEYLKKESGCPVTVLGIQPECLDFGENMSPEVENAVDDIVNVLKEIFESLGR